MGPATGVDEVIDRPPVRSLVLTPLGRIAKILSYDDDGRARLRYQNCGKGSEGCDLMPTLLKPYDPTPRPLHRPKP